jgi:branched-chain amino acid transport system ATP-binding protein
MAANTIDAPGAPGMPLLSVQGLSKHYQGVSAVQDVSLSVSAGQVAGLIGPNGAGKTTAFSIIAGDVAADAGDVEFDGESITGLRPNQICAAGIARTYQNSRLFTQLSCLENVLAARFVRTRASVVESVASWPTARRERRRDLDIAYDLLDRVGLGNSAQRRPSQLSYGNMRRLEIARALATEPKLLLMDEPTAGLAVHVIDDLLETIRSLVRGGLTILLIEHNMRVVTALCSEVAAMDHGVIIAQGAPEVVLQAPAVVDAYLGIA